MCDCLEERKRLLDEQRRKQDSGGGGGGGGGGRASSRGGGGPVLPEISMRTILGLSGLFCLVGGILLRTLSPKTTRRILTMLGLGFLYPKSSYCDPCPLLNANKVKYPNPCDRSEPPTKKCGCAES